MAFPSRAIGRAAVSLFPSRPRPSALINTPASLSLSLSPSTMPPSRSASSAAGRPLAEPRPSSSVVLLSPTNQVLLLHRVQTSTSFASAHVFPGGNLDAFHDGAIPAPDAPERHRDGPAYRMGAIRETFEETGILLAKRAGQLVQLSQEERDAARKEIHGNNVKFPDWLASLGAEPDLNGLIPFTRWVTPAANKKRFTTQMYLYQLPLSVGHLPSEMLIPTPDNGVEHTAAQFAPAETWLARTAASELILFPPQAYLLVLLSTVFAATKPQSTSTVEGPLHRARQRRRLMAFLKGVPTAETEAGKKHATAKIPWGDKVMSPHNLLVRASDGRVVLGLDRPGPELKGTERGGDWERVVLVNFNKEGPRDVEIRNREEILAEERKLKEKEKL